MAMFKKPEPAQPTDNGNGKPPVQSKYLAQIHHLRAIKKHFTAYMDLNSMDNFDMQKGVDFVDHRITQLTNVIEESGGQVDQESIEEQIKDYIPKALQRDRVVDETN